MDVREMRGIELAKSRTIRRDGVNWIVPSQTGKGFYRVTHIAHRNPECSCPDYEIRGGKCKHIFAVAYAISRQANADGTTTVITQKMTVATTERTVYPQNWPAYNEAQTNEKEKFQSLLHDLCRGISEPQIRRQGRPTD